MRIKVNIIVFLIITTALCGCADGRRALSRKSVDSKYGDWIETTGLFENKALALDNYLEDAEGRIEVSLYTKDGKETEGYKELSDLIDKHNDFVLNNPEYFNDEIKIEMHTVDTAGVENLFFFSDGDSRYGYQFLSEDLGMSNNAEIKYISIKIIGGEYEIADYPVNYNIPVVILCDEGAGPTKEKYEILKHFNGIEKVVLDYRTEEKWIDASADYVLEYAPNVEIYKFADDMHLVRVK